MAQDYRLSALERQIASRSTREYAKLGKGLSRGMRGLSARGLIGSSEQEELLADIAERKALVESESTAQRDMLRDQITQEEEAKRGANLRNALSIGGTLLGAGVGLAFALPTGGLSVAAGLSGGAGLGSALGKIVGGGVTGTWDPTAANDIVTGFDALTKVDPVEELDKKLRLIRMYTASPIRLGNDNIGKALAASGQETDNRSMRNLFMELSPEDWQKVGMNLATGVTPSTGFDESILSGHGGADAFDYGVGSILGLPDEGDAYGGLH